MTSLGNGSRSAMYTQFCIGVELGDDTLVRDLIVRGANTMVSYGVDGIVTTPMRSALSKGDLPMALALLTSRSTKVKLADLEAAPRLDRNLVTPVLIRRLTDALEDEARDELTNRRSVPLSRQNKVQLADTLAWHIRSEEPEYKASPTDKPRCPPENVVDEEEDEDNLSTTTTTSSKASVGTEQLTSEASSAEDSSEDEDLS